MSPLYEYFMSHREADGLRGLLHVAVLLYAIWIRLRLFRAERRLRELAPRSGEE